MSTPESWGESQVGKFPHPLLNVWDAAELAKFHKPVEQPPSTADYIIYKIGNVVYAKNGKTGTIDFSGTDASTVIQNVINSLQKGGKIVVVDDISLNSGLTIPNAPFILDFNGRTVTPANNMVCFTVQSYWSIESKRCKIKNVLINAEGKTGVTGVRIDDSWGVEIEGLIMNYGDKAVNIRTVNYFSESIMISHLRTIFTKYPIFIEKVGGTGSVSQLSLRNVFLHHPVEGIHIGTGITWDRGVLDNVVIWLYNNQKGIYVDGWMSNLHGSICFESDGTTPIAIDIGPNATINAPLAIAYYSTFSKVINNPYGKELGLRTADRSNVYIKASSKEEVVIGALDENLSTIFNLRVTSSGLPFIDTFGKEFHFWDSVNGVKPLVAVGKLWIQQSGVNVSVPANSTSINITLPITEPDTNYGVLVIPSWNTTVYVTNKTTTGFRINFGTAPSSNSMLDWFTFRR